MINFFKLLKQGRALRKGLVNLFSERVSWWDGPKQNQRFSRVLVKMGIVEIAPESCQGGLVE